MDIFAFHRDVVDEYASYVSSFIDIRDDRIRDKVTQSLSGGELWPQPLIQFNPAYRETGQIDDLCASGLLHPALKRVFTGYWLYEHQVRAIELGTRDQDFIVTSGTGSGKSLTYLGTIFHHILHHRPERGILAIIVYPMNALINSQHKEIEKYQRNYEEHTGQPFPIRFAQYTGQEGKDKRHEVIETEPHILLTNYMMMELIMTRQREQRLRASIQQHLKYLVYDELHTYRGRQGADVGMLNRRIHEFARRPLVCIGTSATMASGKGTLAEQRRQVADVAGLIFGKSFDTDQVIGEVLTTQFEALAGDASMRAALTAAVTVPVDVNADEESLLRHPIASWLENAVGLAQQEGQWVRRKPLSRPEITALLMAETGLDEPACSHAIMSVLQWVEVINQKRQGRGEKPFLPFKLHQFIAQSGSVYVTLEDRASRTITLDAGYYIRDEEDKQDKPIFPVAFSRLSGHDFTCVFRKDVDGQLIPREFFDLPRADDDDETGLGGSGYVLLDFEEEVLWDEAADLESLPESWLNRNKRGEITSVKLQHRHKIPQRIYFDASGAFSEDPDLIFPYKGWYVPAKLPLDPTTGIVYDSRTSEYTKLARLGSEARSTSTSVIARSVVRKLREAEVHTEGQKLLSFTDNRQDASLQAGHFNDFNQVLQLRAAIYHAVAQAPGQRLEASNLARTIFEHLGLPETEYARNPTPSGGFRFATNENEEALKKMIFYRALYDLRRSWRVILPNLEQCALLAIDYKDLDSVAAQDDAWRGIPGFAGMEPAERRRLLQLILDYFRTSYALDHHELGRSQLEDNANLIRDRLKSPWGLDQTERLVEPSYLRLQPYVSRRGRRTASIGYMSQLGQFLRQHEALQPLLGNRADYEAFVEHLLDLFVGFYFTVEDGRQNGQPVKLYRLQVGTVLWTAGEGVTAHRDIVRVRTYKKLPPPRVNRHFKQMYEMPASGTHTLHGAEHTGQLQNDDRKDREDKFRIGEINTLFCSPTMELGIDIADLSVVHLRNVPPNPANYAQRSGRAGRSGQAALVVTYCANGSPHDRHYFQNSKDMVAGIVTPPRIDLANRELLLTHLYAIYLTEVGLRDLDESVSKLIDLTTPTTLPLRAEVGEALRLPPERKARVRARFERILDPLIDSIRQSWFTNDWVEQTLEDAPQAFDRAFDRWRRLYQAAVRQREEAQQIIDDPGYKASHDEVREARREEHQARRQLEILRNERTGSPYYSEFYPYRYLAAEGFLPGYNFTRLPIRAFLPHGDAGEYISRPRHIALREFGPRNLIYHNGSKYEILRQQMLDVESKLEKAKVATASGYFLAGADYNLTNCPITGAPLSTDADRRLFPKLIELAEVRTYPRENITCEEEERSREGYDIRTYFAVDGPLEDVEVLDLKRDRDVLLTIRYIPTARLYFLNAGWSYYRENGFVIETKTGKWKKSPKIDLVPGQEMENPVELVQIYTSDVADALYIHPSSALGLGVDGVITLQYALEKAIGAVFQVETGEISSTLMGETDAPNIMIYEAAEGSLGILSQIVAQPDRFRAVVREAYDLCHFNLPEREAQKKPPASYDDLLSYYNQRHHPAIDRHLIKGALEMLMACTPEVRPRSGQSYEEHYQALLRQADPTSRLETDFLTYLYEHRLRLPDKAQFIAPHLYVQPDFFYEPNVVVFVDGSVHDDEGIRQEDRKKRRKLRDGGYRVISYYYQEDLDAIIEQHGDIFTPVS